MVARGGIEPPTRGFSVARRARLRATKTKSANSLLLGRPNRPARPTLSRTLGLKSCRARRGAELVQRVTCIPNELFPNLEPNRRLSRRCPCRRSPSGRPSEDLWTWGTILGRSRGFRLYRMGCSASQRESGPQALPKSAGYPSFGMQFVDVHNRIIGNGVRGFVRSRLSDS